MAALSDRAHLIAPDLRGAGQSDAPATGYDSRHGGARHHRPPRRARPRPGRPRRPRLGSARGLRPVPRPSRSGRAGTSPIAVPAPYLRMSPRAHGRDGEGAPAPVVPVGDRDAPARADGCSSRGRQRLAHWLLRGFEGRPMDDADVAAYVEALRDPARAQAASRSCIGGLILPGFVNDHEGRLPRPRAAHPDAGAVRRRGCAAAEGRARGQSR